MASSMAAFGRTNAPALGAELVSGALGYANLLNQQRRLGLMERQEAQESEVRGLQIETAKRTLAEAKRTEEDLSNPVSIPLALKDMGPNQKKHFTSLLSLHGVTQNEAGNWVSAKGLPVTKRDVAPLWEKMTNQDVPTLAGHYEAVALDAQERFSNPKTTEAEKQAAAAEFKEAWRMLAELKSMGKEPKTPNEIQLVTDSLREQLKREPTAQEVSAAVEAYKTRLSQAGRAVFGTVPTTTPGVFFDRLKKRWYENQPDGSQRELSSYEVKQRNLQYRQEVPTETLKTMTQIAPSVTWLAGETKQALFRTSVGPLAGRWKDLWAGKVGAEDKDFITLRTNVELLKTLLMKMHVGSRGGEYVQKGFEKFLDSGKESSANLNAALDQITKYAAEIEQGTIPRELQDAEARENKTPAPGAPASPTPAAVQPPQFSTTATNPQTGEKVGWDGMKWVPIK